MKEYIFKADVAAVNEEGAVCIPLTYEQELIRCKDCRYWKDPHDYVCPSHSSGDPYIDYDQEPDFFCASGERKEP
jgi:hypothetical protein